MAFSSNSIENAAALAANNLYGIIHLVNLSIITEGGKTIDHFKSFKLSQSSVTHHDFTLVLAHDSTGRPQNQYLEDGQSLLGKRIVVNFTYKYLNASTPFEYNFHINDKGKIESFCLDILQNQKRH